MVQTLLEDRTTSINLIGH